MIILIDILVILVIALYVFDGYRQGFLKMLFDLAGIVISFLFALKYYSYTATYLIDKGINISLARSLGFFSLWAICQIIFYLF